jgi:SulP family sulfate permease
MDPVKFRVAIPAADPPDNITHDYRERARVGAM